MKTFEFPTFLMALNAEFLLLGFQAPELRAHRGGDSAVAEISRGTFAVIGRSLWDIKKMSCCAIGCKNRHGQSKEIRFYRIPSMSTPFNVERRSLWLKAINRTNWSDASIRNARICSVHFISGKGSMYYFFPGYVI